MDDKIFEYIAAWLRYHKDEDARRQQNELYVDKKSKKPELYKANRRDTLSYLITSR